MRMAKNNRQVKVDSTGWTIGDPCVGNWSEMTWGSQKNIYLPGS